MCYDDQPTAVYYAVAKSNTSILITLLKDKANPNLRGSKVTPPLHKAVAKGSIYMMDLLLRHGAKVNVVDCLNNGKTPIHYAAIDLDLSSIEFLLDHGAKCDTDSNGMTALDCMRKRNQDEIGSENYRQCERKLRKAGFYYSKH